MRAVKTRPWRHHWLSLKKGWPVGLLLTLLLAPLLGLASLPAQAQWPAEPLRHEIGLWEASLGILASGGIASADADHLRPQGQLRLRPRLTRTYDSGMELSLQGEILALHDPLLFDRYGNRAFQTLFLALQMGLGRLEMGLTEGAAARLGLTGPKINPLLSLGDPQISLFRDPTTGRSQLALFNPRSVVGTSANFAKLSYYSPKIFGIQIGASFTPHQSKTVLPFLTAGPDLPNRQTRIWEMAAKYEMQAGDGMASVFGGVTMGHNDWRGANHEGLTDWGFGVKLDHPLGDDLTGSLGAALRRSNAYGFVITEAQAKDNSYLLLWSAALRKGDWSAGFEYSTAMTSGAGLTALDMTGLQASLAYQITPQVQISAGWQQLEYQRQSGVFFNGRPQLKRDAAFLHFTFNG